MIGSRPSSSGHFAHRGRPARSREEIGLLFPHAAHRPGRGPHSEQYQSWPRRWKLRSCLPHVAQHGSATTSAPALRNAISRSPMRQTHSEKTHDADSGTLRRWWSLCRYARLRPSLAEVRRCRRSGVWRMPRLALTGQRAEIDSQESSQVPPDVRSPGRFPSRSTGGTTYCPDRRGSCGT